MTGNGRVRFRFSNYHDGRVVEYFGEHYKGNESLAVVDGEISEAEFERDVLPYLDDFDKAYWLGQGYATDPPS